jgi:UDP:flavonoid glycosyltransferase YjiC (YdhE family)
MGVTTDSLFNAVRRQLGLPRERDLMRRAAIEGPLVLGLWSASFRPRHADDPPGAAICGFPWFDRHREQEHDTAEIESFLREGEPPILFSLGTAAVHVAGEFYSHAAEACRLLNRRGMLLIGRATPEVAGLTERVRTFTYAPFSTVMPRVAVNVHHGGVGTTAQALRAGRPMVVIPHAHDQFDNAMRVRGLGVGTSVPSTRVSGKRLADAIVNVDVPSVRARAAEVGTIVGAQDGACQAIDLLESFLTRR